MRRTVPTILLATVLLSVAVMMVSDESSAAICEDIRVYIQNEDGTYTESVVGGVQTVRAAIDRALDEQGRTMELNITGTNIVSIDGRKAGEDHYWRLFQWLPSGTAGWGVQTFNAASDAKMVSGTTYCINLSTMSDVDGSLVYSKPTFEPVSEGYVFIRFANGYSPDNDHVNAVFTPEIRRDGFWVKGVGSTLGEVLEDAIESNWPGELVLQSLDSGGNNLSSWISSLFGLSDVRIEGSEDSWAYWSQWTWIDNQWGYNQWTLGYYDPAVYRYLEVIYLISTPDPYGDDYIIDKGGPDPDPVNDGITCLKNNLTVDFRLADGTLWSTQTVKYGNYADTGSVNEPQKAGKGFVGWGDVTSPITQDTTFVAEFVDITSEMYRVSYRNEFNEFICNEYVLPGGSATYDGQPVKKSTQQYHYIFTGWSRDLSSVDRDMVVTPLYDPVLREYQVDFNDFDRTPLESVIVEYGSAVTSPEPPGRNSTVKYQYVFVGWSLTPNNYVHVDLENITGSVSVFAYYEPCAREYTLTFMEGDSLVNTYVVRYGTVIGGTYAIDLFKGECIVKMYRDADMTREYLTNHVIIGDTTVYIERVMGSYDSERDQNGNMTGDEVYVSFGPSPEVSMDGDTVILCDISQFPNGTKAVIDGDSLNNLADSLGGGTYAKMVVPRGSICMTLSEFIEVMAEGESVSFSVGNGPSSVKISSALKKIDYSAFYRLNLRSDNLSVMDLDIYGIVAQVSLLLELDDGAIADVWNITSSGATTHIDPGYTHPYVTFRTSLIQFYAVGGSGGSSGANAVVDPRGEVDVDLDGSGMDGHATLVGLVMDNRGEVMYIPSYIDGCVLRSIGPGALNGLVNTSTVVVPVTVSTFSWNNWTNSGVRDVYFLGDMPVFEGDVPAGVGVHYSPDASGWDSSVGYDDLVIHRYDGSYKKDIFAFTYFVIDDEVTVHRYLFGNYVSLPESISVGGTDYPVTSIGDAAFMFSRDPVVKDLYDLRFSNYNLETMELNLSVEQVLTCAFYGSTIKYLLLLDSLEYVWDHAFYDCATLNNVTFPDGLVFIGRSAFQGCSSSSFARVTLPDSVRMVCEYAFYGCSGVTKVSLGNGITSVPEYCFGRCSSMTELELADSITSIADHAFRDCVGLQYVDLNNVSVVGNGSFQSTTGQSELEFVVIGSDVSSLGDNAFFGNTSLVELEIHCRGFETFETAFQGIDLDSVTFFVANEYLDEWEQYNTVPLVEEEIKDDDTLLHTVELGLLVFFVVIGVITYIRRMKG